MANTSEFMIATCHCHQGPITAQQWLFEDQVPDFLVDFAHQAIDNGADMFVGHGPHVVRGVEIYKGKPIFYGMGEFYYQWQHMDSALLTGSWGQNEVRGDSDVASRVSASWRPVNLESMVAQRVFDKGKLVALSKPFGATITIQNNVGVIRVGQGTSGSSGNN
jgi:poly-gamma-glutamate synthesis protein (capsule biosynthesis protein)